MLGRRDLIAAREIAACRGCRAAGDLLRRALRDDLTTTLASPGAEVHHVVRGADRLLVMLDHEDRVAGVAQMLQRLEKLSLVAVVQADARLVEDVQHVHEAAADLARKSDPLRLSARERRCGAIQREIVQPHV